MKPAPGMEQATIWLGVLLVGILAGPAAAGVYGGASRFVQAGLIIDSAIRVVVSPRFSAMLHLKDTKGVQSLYSMLRLACSLSLPRFIFFWPSLLRLRSPFWDPSFLLARAPL